MPTTLHINNEAGLLTPREAQALPLIALGKDNEEIGICMGISRRTAKYHVENTMHKLRADNRAHLVHEAFKRGILEFMCLLLIIQGGLFIPLQSATETNQQNPFRTRSGGTRRSQLHARFTRSVQIRINGRKG